MNPFQMGTNQAKGQNPAQNIERGLVSRNHGGHELYDVHEVLSGTIGLLDHYLLYSQHVKDPELRDILNRQYQAMTDDYNMLVQAFRTGQDPAHGTQRYQMTQSNENIRYGLQPGQPKKPCQSVSEINDQEIAGFMMGHLKGLTGSKALAALEITNPVVRRVVADSIPNCIEMAYELFLYQNKKGYYQVAQYSEQDMQILQNAYGQAQGQPQMQNPQQLQ